MEGILNLDNLNIELLDQVVQTAYFGTGPQRKQAETILVQFQQLPDAYSKYVALQVLEKAIATRWHILGEATQGGIRMFIISFLLKMTQNESDYLREKTLVNKMNAVLIQILKQQWPKAWPNFIPEIISSSKASIVMCENTMCLFKLLAEEIFDSPENLTTIKAKTLKTQFDKEFALIFQLCSEVLNTVDKPSLVLATLDALLRFIKWVPLGFIFETNMLETLIKCLANPYHRNTALSCFNEIASLPIYSGKEDSYLRLFTAVLESINTNLPLNIAKNLINTYEELSDGDQVYVQNIALFISTFLSNNLIFLEGRNMKDAIQNAHQYLLFITVIDDRELLKTCLDYWNRLVFGLFQESPSDQASPLMLGGFSQPNSRKIAYSKTLSDLRLAMIERMVKPEEVFIVEDENGEVIRERTKETDTIVLYKTLKEILVFLTHLDYDDTENIMTEKLSRQVDGSEWSRTNLNKLCWAIGSISGAMNELVEKRFLVNIIRDLLGLTEMKKGKDNKAIVASNIMYIVGQYPRFLKAHWKFLKTVVKKLFEFMHETHEGVQEMACDTFIKISQKCKRHFVIHQAEEPAPFINAILDELPQIISDLCNAHIHVVYEAIGHMIQAQPDRNEQFRLINKMMENSNAQWRMLVEQTSNPENLKNPDILKQLQHVLQMNIAVCTSVGPGYINQIGMMYINVLSIYRACNRLIHEAVVTQGVVGAHTPVVRGMRAVKSLSLKYIEAYVQRCEDVNVVMQSMLPPLLEAILADYAQSIEQARDAQVLNVVTSFVLKAQGAMTNQIPNIFNYIFTCTVHMINKDFENYPDHRSALFRMLQAINQHCFPALVSLPQPQFEAFYHSIVWAMRHTIRDILDTGLNILLEFLQNLAKSDPAIFNGFYQSHLIPMLQDIFMVVTDSSHKSGFKLQMAVLSHIFGQLPNVSVPVYDVSKYPNTNNMAFVEGFIKSLLLNAFPNLNAMQVDTFIRGLFDLHKNQISFKQHFRDFLISMKEFAGNNQDLFREEFELEQERKKEVERMVPGLVNPYDIDD